MRWVGGLRRAALGLVRLGKRRVGEEEEERRGDAYGPQRKRPCRCTFVFDPAGRLIYFWTMIVSGEEHSVRAGTRGGCQVSAAYVYNLWVVSYRFAFDEINPVYLLHVVHPTWTV